MKHAKPFVAITAFTLLCALGCEQRTPEPVKTDTRVAPPTSAAADNTVQNKVDRNTDTKTPMDQSETSADIKITAEIRKAIMADNAMSTNAQNCKIITEKSGIVTLRGVVASQAEKDSVEAKAKAVAGVTRVENLLEIKAN